MVFTKLLVAKPGDLVFISDEISLRDNNSVIKLEHRITKVNSFRVPKQKISYHIFEIENERKELSYVILNINDDKHEMGLYFDIAEFPQGSNRTDCLNQGIRWLFQQPENDNFKASDLLFTDDINHGEVKYTKKFPTIFGELRTDMVNFCSVTEYQSKNEIDNQDILLLEIGGLDSKNNLIADGGSLRLLQGRKLNNNDIEVLNG